MSLLIEMELHRILTTIFKINFRHVKYMFE